MTSTTSTTSTKKAATVRTVQIKRTDGSGRDSRGRLTARPANSGRAPLPLSKAVARRVLRAHLSEAVYGQIVAKAVSQAIAGDSEARAWLTGVLEWAQ